MQSRQTGSPLQRSRKDRSEFRAKVQKFTYPKKTIPEQITATFTASTKQTALLPINQKLNQVLLIWDIQGIIKFFKRQNDEFQAGSVKHAYENWAFITSDKEVLKTITGMPINIKHDLPQSLVMSLPLGKTESEFIDKEKDSLLKKRVIVKSHHETGEFISPISVTSKSDGGF